jgi:hypothetical protein
MLKCIWNAWVGNLCAHVKEREVVRGTIIHGKYHIIYNGLAMVSFNVITTNLFYLDKTKPLLIQKYMSEPPHYSATLSSVQFSIPHHSSALSLLPSNALFYFMIIVFTIFPPTYFDQHSDQDQLKQFCLAHNTDDTHHKYPGLKLTILLP